MSATERALTEIAATSARRGAVIDALVAGGARRYLQTRILRFSLNRLLSAGLHVIEVILLAGTLPTRALLAAVAVRHGAALLEAAWWGGLEPYRHDVRTLTAAGRLRRRDEVVRRMRRNSLAIGAGLFTLALAVFVVGAVRAVDVPPSSRGAPGAAAIFAAVVVLRLAVDVPLRAFHSTVQALRRVWRPGWSFIVPDAVQLLVLVVGVPRLGAWAVPLASLLSMVVAEATTYFYTRRTWLALRLEPTRARARLAARHDDDSDDRRHPLLHAAGWASSRAASLAVLTVVAAPGRAEDFLVALCVFLAAPLLDAVVGQANLYYVDLARLFVPRWAHLRRRLVFFMLGGAVVFSVAAGAVALGLAAVFTGPHFGAVAVPLAFLFVVRAPLAVVAVARFTAGAPVPLIAGAVGVVVATALSTALEASPPHALCVGAVVGTVVTGLWPGPRPRAPRGASTLLVEFAGLPPERIPALASRLPFTLRRIGSHHAMAALPSPTPSRATLVQAFGGFARELVILPPGASLLSAPTSWQQRLQPRDEQPLPAAFSAMFPDGLCLDLRTGTDAARALPRHVRGRLLRAVDRFLDEGLPVDGGPVEVTASAPGGRVELVFVVPRRTPLRTRRAWASRVALGNALGPAATTAAPTKERGQS